jgi:hypothetical protein
MPGRRGEKGRGPSTRTRDARAAVIFDNGAKAAAEPPEWNSFEGYPITGDRALERAVTDISTIAVAGGTTIYNAPAVRKVLLDLLNAEYGRSKWWKR